MLCFEANYYRHIIFNEHLQSLYLCQMLFSETQLPSKQLLWWRRVEDVLKTSFVFAFRRRLQDVFKTSWSRQMSSTSYQDEHTRLGHKSSIRLQGSLRCLVGVFKSSCKHVLEMFSRRYQDAFQRRSHVVFNTSSRRSTEDKTGLVNTSLRHLQDILKKFSRYLQEIFKTSSWRITQG